MILTHPLLPGTHKFRSLISRIVVGAAQILFVDDSSSVPADRYRYVLACSVRHTDGGTTHTVWLYANIPVAGVGTTVTLVGLTTPAAVIGGVRVGCLRPILLPPGGAISAAVDALGVGSSVVLEIAFVEHRILDPSPPL